MTTVTRRKVLKGGTALVGGMAGILATGRAPAFAQGTTVHWLRWTDFVPASDQLLRKEMLPEAEKALGIKINIETVNGNDLQPRMTSSVQSGGGPDLIMSLTAVSPVRGERRRPERLAEESRKRRAGSTSTRAPFQRRQDVLLDAVDYRRCHDCVSQVVVRRDRDHVRRDVGHVLRRRQEVEGKGPSAWPGCGHTFGDAPAFIYPLWSFGGKEVEADGKTVAINRRTRSNSSSS